MSGSWNFLWKINSWSFFFTKTNVRSWAFIYYFRCVLTRSWNCTFFLTTRIIISLTFSKSTFKLLLLNRWSGGYLYVRFIMSWSRSIWLSGRLRSWERYWYFRTITEISLFFIISRTRSIKRFSFVILFRFTKAYIIVAIYLYFGTSFPKPLVNS